MNSYAILPVTLLVLVASEPRLDPTSHDLTDSARARVESGAADFLASYREVIEGDDTEAIRGLYVADERFAWFTDGVKKYTSADDVIAGLASMQGMKFSTEASDVEVVPLAPDLAHARTAFRTKILQGETVVYEFSGVITWLLEEVQAGEWRVLTGHTSTPKER